jgi:acyl-CoA reductase-like NAD-dependent aldehyde dehydrogenase
VVAALAFGLRLNGSATCMAPRRLFLVGDHPGLVTAMLEAFKTLPVVALPVRTQAQLAELLEDAQRLGGSLLMDGSVQELRFVVINQATPDMRIAQSDIFAPVLSIFDVPDMDAAIAAHAPCPYALTAAIFGPQSEARALASRLPVGTILINDFGVTRGREGLLEMTVLKTIVTQHSRDLRAYRPTTADHEPFFAAYLETVHSGSWRTRWHGLRRLVRVASKLD